MGKKLDTSVVRYVITEMRTDYGLRSVSGRPWNHEEKNILKEGEKNE